MHLRYIADNSVSLLDFLMRILGMLKDPVLILLLIVLGGGIYYLVRQIKIKEAQITEKEKEIKELHDKALNTTITNLQVINQISSSLDKNDSRTRDTENLVREISNTLKLVSKALNI